MIVQNADYIPKKKALTFVRAFCSNMAVREGFEPSIHLRVYTLSRRAPSATQTPHRFVTALCTATGRYYSDRQPDGQAVFIRCLSSGYSALI